MLVVKSKKFQGFIMMKILFLSAIFLTSTVGAQDSVNDVFAETGNLTDQQATEANEFVHTGRNARVIEEKCANLTGVDLKNCDINRVNESGAIIHPLLDDNIGKAYAMLFGGAGILTGGGIGPSIKMEEQNATTGQKKTDTDYCMYLAMGYEALAGMIQTAQQQVITTQNQEIRDVQMQALVTLRDAHQARSDTSYFQAGVYGAVAGCYGVRMLGLGGAVDFSDPMIYVKSGGAILLSGLFFTKALKHADAVKKVQQIIDDIDSSENCNPFTQTNCFCTEPTSASAFPAQFQQVCVRNGGDFTQPIKDLGCAAIAGSELSFDKECKCKQSNTCFKGQISSFNPNIDAGGNFTKSLNATFDLASSGQFDRAKLNSLTTANTAFATKLRNKAKLKGPLPSVALNAEQKKNAAELAKLIPADLAALTAAQQPFSPAGSPPLAGGTAAALAKLPEGARKKVAAAKIETSYESSGQGFASLDKKEAGFVMPTFGQAAKKDSTEVLSFAEKAMSKADITNNKDTPIFDIITNRYRRSGWNKVESAELK